MMKHLTALILALAIANPFCCCFGMESVPGKAQPAPCCQASVDESNDSYPDDNSLSKSCPCKGPIVQAEHKDFDLHGNKVLKNLLLFKEYQNEMLAFVATSDILLGFFMRPPPPTVKLHIVNCVYRT